MKLEGSIKEIIEFIESKHPETASELKTKMMGALFSLVDSSEMKTMIEQIAVETATKRVQGVVDNALSTMLVLKKRSQWDSTPASIEGWLALELQEKLGNILQDSDNFRVAVSNAVSNLATVQLDALRTRGDKLLELVDTKVDNAAHRAVRSSIAQEYKERVADEFKDMHLEDTIMKLIQKVFGQMLVSGQLQYTLPKEDVNNGQSV